MMCLCQRETTQYFKNWKHRQERLQFHKGEAFIPNLDLFSIFIYAN